MFFCHDTIFSLSKIIYKRVSMAIIVLLSMAPHINANPTEFCILDASCWKGTDCIQFKLHNGLVLNYKVSIGGCSKANLQNFISYHTDSQLCQNGKININANSQEPCG